MRRTLGGILIAGEEYSPLVTALRNEQRAILARFRLTLTAKQARLLDMRYGEDLTFVAIARQLRISEKRVIRMHSRMIQTLRDEFAALGIDALGQILCAT